MKKTLLALGLLLSIGSTTQASFGKYYGAGVAANLTTSTLTGNMNRSSSGGQRDTIRELKRDLRDSEKENRSLRKKVKRLERELDRRTN